jgi:transcriptional regulator with XRE-family HTH domain
MQRHPTLNLALKTAILASGKQQKRIARDTRIDETTLSHIVRGRREATEKEREKLARALGRRIDELFPSQPEPEAMAS